MGEVKTLRDGPTEIESSTVLARKTKAAGHFRHVGMAEGATSHQIVPASQWPLPRRAARLQRGLQGTCLPGKVPRGQQLGRLPEGP